MSASTESQNSTMDVEVVYEEPLEMLDESEHLSNIDLVREVNKLRREINRLRK